MALLGASVTFLKANALLDCLEIFGDKSKQLKNFHMESKNVCI